MKTLRTLFHACLLAVAALVAPRAARAGRDNWPQWRGPSGQGVSSETALPDAWSPAEHVRWKTPLDGRGHSAPIVWGNRVFVTTAIEGEPMPGHTAVTHVDGGKPFLHPDSVGVDRRTTLEGHGTRCGERRRRVGADGVRRARCSTTAIAAASYASATPVTDGERVYAYFGPGRRLRVRRSTASRRGRPTVGKIKTLGLGIGTSPVLYRDLLILQCDDDDGKESAIVALDKRTGKEVWRTKRDVQVSWSTPVLVDVPATRRRAARTELVTNGTEWIIAYDPRRERSCGARPACAATPSTRRSSATAW